MCILCVFNTAYLLYYCERGGVDLMALNPNPKDPIFLQCFDTVDCIFLFFFPFSVFLCSLVCQFLFYFFGGQL